LALRIRAIQLIAALMLAAIIVSPVSVCSSRDYSHEAKPIVCEIVDFATFTVNLPVQEGQESK
jgi:hypothetical protein